jgi:hypothetical protein
MSAPLQRPSRRRAAIVFAMVGLVVGSAHVLVNDASSIRLWREILPLAGLACGAFGWLLRPHRYYLGMLAGTLAVLGFTLTYAVAETIMTAGRGEIDGLTEWWISIMHWAGMVFSQTRMAWLTSILVGGLAGAWLGWRVRH